MGENARRFHSCFHLALVDETPSLLDPCQILWLAILPPWAAISLWFTLISSAEGWFWR